jgi:hypothetical protein
VIAVQSSLDRLGQLPGLGIVTLALLACGLGLLFAEYGPAVLRGRAAIPVAMLAGSLLFLVLTGLVRAGVNHVGIKTVEGSFFASQGRYAYVVVTLLTPALALAVDTLIRRWDKLAIALAALVVVATPAYVLQYRDDARAFAQSATDKQWILTAPRVPLAAQLPRDLAVVLAPRYGLVGGYVPLGWLLDGVSSGRVPAPKHMTPDYVASETLRLTLRRSLAPSKIAEAGSCSTLSGPTMLTLNKGDPLTLRSGRASVVYESSLGRSRPQGLSTGTVVAVTGPLELRLTPTSSSAPVVCRP